MSTVVAINGRYARMHVSGVQRYAAALVQALWPSEESDWAVLIPPFEVASTPPEVVPGSSWSGWRGHLWEQSVLPAISARERTRVLVNLCNWAPVLVPGQVVAMHDAATWVTPQYFSGAYLRWNRIAMRRLSRSAAIIVTLSERTRQELAERADVDPRRVVVVPPGVDGARFTPSLRQAHATGRPYLLFVGAHDRRKNVEFLMEWFPEARRRFDVDLHVVAHPRSQPHGPGMIAGDGVVLHQELRDDELAVLYANAEAVVWPSHYEGFGLPLLEGMAAGTPFVSTAVGAAEELAVSPHQIVPLDRDAWLTALTWVIEHRDDLAVRSARRAADYRWDCSATVLRTAIDEVTAL